MTQSEMETEDQELQAILEKENLDLEDLLSQGTKEGIDSLPPEEFNKFQQPYIWKTQNKGLERQRSKEKQSNEGVKMTKPIPGLAPRNPGKKRGRKKKNELLMECRKLMINSVIKDERGILYNSHAEIEKALVKHFQGIAKETCYDREKSIKNFKRHIPRLVSSDDNFNLNNPITEEEVSEVLKEMQNGKAQGPDSFNVDFFKAYWSIVKKGILNVVEDSRMNKTILKALSTYFIALIPKTEDARTPNKFRPIALCNVVYKKISKVVANRLKPLLPSVVSME
eukprot:PITA_16965